MTVAMLSKVQEGRKRVGERWGGQVDGREERKGDITERISLGMVNVRERELLVNFIKTKMLSKY